MVVLGAGRTPCWRRCDFPLGTCAANRASTRSGGAGGRGISTPAPGRGYTCAREAGYLRQRYVLRSVGVLFVNWEGRRCERNARVRHRRTGAIKAPAAPFPHYYPIQLPNPKFTAHPTCHSTALCGTLARAARRFGRAAHHNPHSRGLRGTLARAANFGLGPDAGKGLAPAYEK